MNLNEAYTLLIEAFRKKKATKVFRGGGEVTVQFYATTIVRLTEKDLFLNHGGWATTTTKVRINTALQALRDMLEKHGRCAGVFQKKYAWFFFHPVQLSIIPFDGSSVMITTPFDSSQEKGGFEKK